MRRAAVLLSLALAGCPLDDCGSPPSPAAPTATTTAPACAPSPLSSSECRLPRVDQPFSVDAYKGVIAFGLGNPYQTEEDVLEFAAAYQTRGWNTLQICSETEFWDGGPTDYPSKPRDPEKLRQLLDLLARVPGLQVALIGNCTLKRQIPLDQQLRIAGQGVSAQQIEAWHRTVAGVAKDFRNVAVFTHNEFDNCRGRSDWGGRPENCAGKEDVRRHVEAYRAAGVQVVTADDSFSWPRPGDPEQLTYGFRLANAGASPASFHPDREKEGRPWDPSPHQLEMLARYNGTYILSETVAWTDYSGNCRGLRTCDPERIPAYIERCAAVSGGRCKFTLHCENCLAGIPGTVIPEAR